MTIGTHQPSFPCPRPIVYFGHISCLTLTVILEDSSAVSTFTPSEFHHSPHLLTVRSTVLASVVRCVSVRTSIPSESRAESCKSRGCNMEGGENFFLVLRCLPTLESVRENHSRYGKKGRFSVTSSLVIAVWLRYRPR